MDIEAILLSLSYLGVFILMIANGSISFPSSQILYIIVGYFVGTGYLSMLPASLIGALGNTIGNILLYEVVRKYGVSALKFLRIYDPIQVRKIEVAFKKHGLWFLFTAKLLPAIKVFAPIPPALSKMNRIVFATVMFFASWTWAFIFILIGYTFGKNSDVFKAYGIILAIVAGIIVYLFYRYINSKIITDEVAHLDKLDDKQHRQQ